MRVLLPLFQKNGKDENTTTTSTPSSSTTPPLPSSGTAVEPNQNQIFQEYCDHSGKEEDECDKPVFLQSSEIVEGHRIQEPDNSKNYLGQGLAIGKSYNQESILEHRKRPAKENETSNCSKPTKRQNTLFHKKPPPRINHSANQPEEDDDDDDDDCNNNTSNNMTAPRFIDEEQREDEILENSPPAAGRNFTLVREDPGTTITTATTTAEHHHDDGDDEDDDDEGNDPPLHLENLAYAQVLKKQGFEIVEQAGDGNCLFRSVSLQVYGDASMHAQVRASCMDFMAVNEEHFGQFVTGETFDAYVARKRLDGVHGNNPEIQAISELYNRPVEVYTPEGGGTPLNIFHEEYGTSDIPIRLSYHDGNHYNAIINPICPTAGLGLGLPDLHPGLADKQQMATAVMESDQQMDLEKAMKESEQEFSQIHDDELQRALKQSTESMAYMYKQKALAFSDLDATAFEMEQTALESSLQTYVQTELGRKRRAKNEDGRARPQSSSPALPVYAPAPPAAAASAAAAAVSAQSLPAEAGHSSTAAAAASAVHDPDEYPPVVQELVMNGFELSKVVRAYELIGDDFDDLLAFLCSTGGYSS